MTQLRISGKELGAVSMPDFCPRCFWIKHAAPNGVPYQIFPGIFSSIDSYTKHVVHTWFDRHPNTPPKWLSSLGDIIGYKEPPHYTKFNFVDATTNVMLTGAPDAIFVRKNSTLIIGDYKTAKFTKAQDTLLPIYETQLNAYALIAEKIGFGNITKLALIYTEPISEKAKANVDSVHSPDGFLLGFSAHILPIALNTSAIPPLLSTTKQILSLSTPPKGRKGCKDCSKVDELVALLK